VSDKANPGRLRTLPDGVEMPLTLATIQDQGHDLRGFGEWTEIWRADVHHYTRGQVSILVDSIPPSILVGAYWAEVRILGYVANQPRILIVGAVNSNTGPLEAQLGPSAAYDFLSMEARQFVNGLPSSDPAEGGQLNGSISARLYR